MMQKILKCKNKIVNYRILTHIVVAILTQKRNTEEYKYLLSYGFERDHANYEQIIINEINFPNQENVTKVWFLPLK